MEQTEVAQAQQIEGSENKSDVRMQKKEEEERVERAHSCGIKETSIISSAQMSVRSGFVIIIVVVVVVFVDVIDVGRREERSVMRQTSDAIFRGWMGVCL